MLIDIHTHAFPEAIAARTLEVLKAGILREQNFRHPSYTDGTIQGLMELMSQNGVDRSVVLPIATKAKQTESILRFAAMINEEEANGLISFGSLHPEREDWKELLRHMKESGFQGLKLHLEFQQMQVDAPRMLDIFQEAERLGLYIILHSGHDIGLPAPVYCTPQRLCHVMEYVSGSYIIAAHLGGWRMWDEVERYLVGTPINLDTAFVVDYIEKEQYRRIIENHGSTKILFGSDAPWERPEHTREGLESLGLNQSMLEDIYYKNALRILK